MQTASQRFIRHAKQTNSRLAGLSKKLKRTYLRWFLADSDRILKVEKALSQGCSCGSPRYVHTVS